MPVFTSLQRFFVNHLQGVGSPPAEASTVFEAVGGEILSFDYYRDR